MKITVFGAKGRTGKEIVKQELVRDMILLIAYC
jgi:putative NADH-flavin reductase